MPSKCNALTNENTPCAKNALKGSKYCFSHQDRPTKIGLYLAISGIIIGILAGLLLGPFWADAHYLFGKYTSVTGQPLDTIPPKVELKNFTNGSEFNYGELKEIKLEYYPQGKTPINFKEIKLGVFLNNEELKSTSAIPEKNDLTISMDASKETPFPVGNYRLKIIVPNMSGISAEKDIIFRILPLPQTKLSARLGDTLQGTQENYLPIYLENTGDVDLTNLIIETSLCYMKDSNGINYPETYYLPRLSKGKDVQIELRNNITIERLKEKTCEPYVDYYSPALSYGFNPFEIASGKQFDQNILGCGNCEYTIKVSADQKIFDPITNIIRAPKLFNVKIDGNYSAEDPNMVLSNLQITPLE